MKNKQLGFTIVELMVGLLLSLLLVGGVLQVYFGTKATYRITEGLSRLQENTRFSVDMLARDIRMAGYVPCSQPQNTDSVVNAGVNDWWAQVFDNRLRGFESEASTFPADIDSAPGTDAILILRGGERVAGVNFYDSANNQFVMQRNLNQDWLAGNKLNGSLMIACDATNATLFQASTVNTNTIQVASAGSSPGNSEATIYAYGNDSQLTNYKAVIYYIAESVSGDGLSLFRKYLNVANENSQVSNREELVEDVENMQLLYGIDSSTDSFANQYIKANQVADWADVVSVKIGLLMASEDGLRGSGGDDTETYVVANTSIGVTGDVTHPQDQRKRYVSEMTVSVRNI
ncbi:MAG: PilW family protein [Gammaproteobacteria bacterium]